MTFLSAEKFPSFRNPSCILGACTTLFWASGFCSISIPRADSTSVSQSFICDSMSYNRLLKDGAREICPWTSHFTEAGMVQCNISPSSFLVNESPGANPRLTSTLRSTTREHPCHSWLRGIRLCTIWIRSSGCYPIFAFTMMGLSDEKKTLGPLSSSARTVGVTESWPSSKKA